LSILVVNLNFYLESKVLLYFRVPSQHFLMMSTPEACGIFWLHTRVTEIITALSSIFYTILRVDPFYSCGDLGQE